MPEESDQVIWDFESAINVLNKLSLPTLDLSSTAAPLHQDDDQPDDGLGLGDFTSLWDFLGVPRTVDDNSPPDIIEVEVDDVPVTEIDTNQLNKGVKWWDELDGADLEDNVTPSKVSAGGLRMHKRAAGRVRAREKAEKLVVKHQPISDSATDFESGEELESLRRSPDRRAVIDSILGRTRPGPREASSPPTSPSPPKTEARTPRRDWPVSNPFLWTAPGVPSPSRRPTVGPRDGLTPRSRKEKLISLLLEKFVDEKKYLKNSSLVEPAFTPLNISNIGIHVFIDISNISIGFHDCLKLARDMPRHTRLRRVPLCFHNFSLVLERGRPATKRVLVGSDKFPAIQQAKSIGYETNILERVHKAKELTPRQKKYSSGGAGSGLETSGSETNTGIARQKWVEQAVDEILHLKILESLIDADKPSTIVLATGDAAEAEYSGGFMKMVERALEKGWMVELVSFKLNTSSLYKRKEFRSKWGPMFKWVQLDEFVEYLIDEEED